jgi:hypothetical protein
LTSFDEACFASGFIKMLSLFIPARSSTQAAKHARHPLPKACHGLPQGLRKIGKGGGCLGKERRADSPRAKEGFSLAPAGSYAIRIHIR